jgi:hypothetical protein
MNLRSKIEKLLRNGYPLSEGPADGVAIPKAAALRLLELLEGSKLAIRGIEVWWLESWGPVPTEDEWQCRRLALEAASDYASRSRHDAIAFLKERQGAMEMFAFDIDEQQEAA